MKSTLIALLLLSVTSIGRARLGETPEELIERFGAPEVKREEKAYIQGRSFPIGLNYTFREGDWTIEAAVVEGRCSRISYSKKGEWSETQITQTLNANSQGAKWALISPEGSGKIMREWKRSDGGAGKWVNIGSLTMEHPAYKRALDTARAKAEALSRRTPNI